MGDILQKQYEVEKTDLGLATRNRPVTAALYINPNGNGLDGSSWANAFTTLAEALDASGADDLTLWLVGPGTYDVDVAGGLSMGTKKISMLSSGLPTIFTNTNVGGTYVFKSETYFESTDCQILKANNIDGIITHGADSLYAIKNIRFDNNHVGGGTESALRLEHGSLHDIQNILISGTVAETTGINVCGGKWVAMKNVKACYCLKGVHINHVDSDQNEFKDFIVWDCAIGIDIDAGNAQLFNKIKFINNTLNVADAVGDHFWKDIRADYLKTYVLPVNLTGTNVLAGAAGVYGADTELIAAGAITNPFYITAIMYEFDAVENYGVGISVDSGNTFIAETVLEVWAATECHRANICPPVGTQCFNKGTRVSAKIKSVTGSNNAKLWLQIVEI